jgi:hypothetical protein
VLCVCNGKESFAREGSLLEDLQTLSSWLESSKRSIVFSIPHRIACPCFDGTIPLSYFAGFPFTLKQAVAKLMVASRAWDLQRPTRMHREPGRAGTIKAKSVGHTPYCSNYSGVSSRHRAIFNTPHYSAIQGALGA